MFRVEFTEVEAWLTELGQTTELAGPIRLSALQIATDFAQIVHVYAVAGFINGQGHLVELKQFVGQQVGGSDRAELIKRYKLVEEKVHAAAKKRNLPVAGGRYRVGEEGRP